MTKVGIIRCQKVENVCDGKMDVEIAEKGVMGFREVGPSTIVGIVDCGGCPGDKVFKYVDLLLKDGAEVIAFATCLTEGNPDGTVCPKADELVEAVTKYVDGRAKILLKTH